MISTATERLVENLYNKFAKIPKNCRKKHLHFKIKTIILKSVDKRIKTTNKKNRYERSGDKDTRRVRLRSYSPVQERAIRTKFFLAH
jgi:hypothetical protein